MIESKERKADAKRVVKDSIYRSYTEAEFYEFWKDAKELKDVQKEIARIQKVLYIVLKLL